MTSGKAGEMGWEPLKAASLIHIVSGMGYTAFQKYIPTDGRMVSVVGEKNGPITERFFDKHYNSRNCQTLGVSPAKLGVIDDYYDDYANLTG